ncbi:MAG: hypothetical protein M3Y51_01790 [Actinomycetota bacterium]|nr:hypothetical protein [Actinomycetota bacterium]
MKLLTALLATAACAVVAGCSGSTSDGATETTPTETTPTTAAEHWPVPVVDGSTYEVPDDLADARPGDVLAAEQMPPTDLLAGAERHRVLYASQDHRGRTVPVSGVVLVPDGPAPEGGWPVVSWGHGTTGVADTGDRPCPTARPTRPTCRDLTDSLGVRSGGATPW